MTYLGSQGFETERKQNGGSSSKKGMGGLVFSTSCSFSWEDENVLEMRLNKIGVDLHNTVNVYRNVHFKMVKT